MERKANQLTTTLQNGTNNRMKEIRNGRKKAEITSTQTPPWKQCQKVMSTNIAARMLQILGLQILLHQSKVHTNLEVMVLYTQIDVIGPLFFTTELG